MPEGLCRRSGRIRFLMRLPIQFSLRPILKMRCKCWKVVVSRDILPYQSVWAFRQVILIWQYVSAKQTAESFRPLVVC